MKSSPWARAGTHPVVLLGEKFGIGSAARAGPTAKAQRIESTRGHTRASPLDVRHHIGLRARARTASAAFAIETFRDDELVLHPTERKIVEPNFGDRFEQLEVMTLLVAPERHRGFKRRTARKIAGNFGDEDRGV